MSTTAATTFNTPSADKMSPWEAFAIVGKLRVLTGVIVAGFTGMVMTRRRLPEWDEALLLLAILVFSATASFVLNNLLDSGIDSHMDRTQDRDMAINLLGRRNLWVISVFVSVATVVICALFASVIAAGLLLLTILTYVIWYTLFLKRNSPFGVILGGVPGALPLLVGSYGISSRFALDVYLLFMFVILWQPPHFWALALKTKDEYEAASVPVLPVVFGNTYTKAFIYIYAFSLLPVSLAITYFCGYGLIYTASAIAFGMAYLVLTYIYVNVREEYKKAFTVSLIYLIGLMIAIIIDILV